MNNLTWCWLNKHIALPTSKTTPTIGIYMKYHCLILPPTLLHYHNVNNAKSTILI